jgi:capsular exopolysaccharide synthesis family protein
LYTLLVTKGPDLGKSCEIRSGRISVGTADDMGLVLTDPAVRRRHFTVVFEEGGWKAITYEPDATILIDRRWQHPESKRRGARIFVGSTTILLYAGHVDLRTARLGAEGLDREPETLRDDALTQVGSLAVRFRHDMLGKAQPVVDRDEQGPRSKRDRRRAEPIEPEEDTADSKVPEVMPGAEGSKLFSANAGMMRLPVPVGRGGNSWSDPEPPKSARATWSPPTGAGALVQKGDRSITQTIKLTETAINAMPSKSRDLVVLYDRDGEFASSIRILATRIEDLRKRLGYKSFLVTSVGDGDGKTVLSNNLALAMSEDSDRKVALVDANFRSPRAGELFNLDLSRGLLAAFSGERPLSQCVARVLGRNLIVLHAGGEHKNPASVLSSPKFKTLLAELYQAVDFMIVDAPSAIPYADVPLIAQHVDAVLLLVASNRTSRGSLTKAMETIGPSRIVGNIFVDRAKSRSKA